MDRFVPQKPQEKEVISMRIPVDMLKAIDQKAAAAGISRNQLINQVLHYALSS